jgi:EmrB/QacA subfamily drug resistance transporter
MAAAEPARGEQPAGNRRMVVAGLMLTLGLAAMDGTIVATAIPSIVRDLGGFALFPWIFSVYLLVQAVTVPVYGRLADIYGRRPVLLVGAAVFILGSVLSGLSWNMVALIVFRGVQGIGAGAVQPITMTVIGDLFSVEERARMQGYFSSVWGISAIVGPALGGLLVQYASWHWIFYLNLPVGAGGLWLVGRYLREHAVRRDHRIDYAGAAVLMAAVGLVVLALLEGGVAWAWTSGPSLAILALAAVLFARFVHVERRAAEPILPLWVFGDRLLLTANAISLVVGTLTIGLSSYLPTFVQGVLGASPLVAGFALGAMSIGWPISSSQSGRLYLRIGFRGTALLGSVVALLGACGLTTLGPRSTPLESGLISLVIGLGLGLFSTAVLVAIQSAVDWHRRGVVTGANMFTRMLGSTLGVAVYGGLVNQVVGHRLAHPPSRLAASLPRSLDAASIALGAPPPALGHLAAAAVAYVRAALNAGIHEVFVGVAVAAVLGVASGIAMPRRGGVRSSAGPVAEEGSP